MSLHHRNLPRVVIIGGGFGGLSAARALAKAPVRVTLLDRQNHHVFQPLLYQVATAALAPSDIADPLRYIVRRQANCEVLLTDVKSIDPAAKMVSTDAGGLRTVRYGTMGDSVLGLDVVLPDGSVVRRHSAVRADNTGYDLAALFVGAEGTLGVVTSVDLRLHPVPAHRVCPAAGAWRSRFAMTWPHRSPHYRSSRLGPGRGPAKST
jgi:hypothetical protein